MTDTERRTALARTSLAPTPGTAGTAPQTEQVPAYAAAPGDHEALLNGFLDDQGDWEKYRTWEDHTTVATHESLTLRILFDHEAAPPGDPRWTIAAYESPVSEGMWYTTLTTRGRPRSAAPSPTSSSPRPPSRSPPLAGGLPWTDTRCAGTPNREMPASSSTPSPPTTPKAPSTPGPCGPASTSIAPRGPSAPPPSLPPVFSPISRKSSPTASAPARRAPVSLGA